MHLLLGRGMTLVTYFQTVLQPFLGIQNSTSKWGFLIEFKYVLRIRMHFHPANCLPYLNVSTHVACVASDLIFFLMGVKEKDIFWHLGIYFSCFVVFLITKALFCSLFHILRKS